MEEDKKIVDEKAQKEEAIKMKEAKELIKAVMRAVVEVEEALEDRSISWTEAFGLIPELKSIFEEAKDIRAIIKELKEAGRDDLEDLYEYAIAELDLKHDLVEDYVEHAMMIIVMIYEMFLIRKK